MAWMGWFDRILLSNKLWRIPGSKRCCGSSDKLITAGALVFKKQASQSGRNHFTVRTQQVTGRHSTKWDDDRPLCRYSFCGILNPPRHAYPYLLGTLVSPVVHLELLGPA